MLLLLLSTLLIDASRGLLFSISTIKRECKLRLLPPEEIPHSAEEIMQMSPNTLAYIGDAAFELFARTHEAWPPKRLSIQQKNVVQMIRAETQAQMLEYLLLENNNNFQLTSTEFSYIRRGRNASSRRGPVRMQRAVYQSASALECLVGYLYLSDLDRCQKLLRHLVASLNSPEAKSKEKDIPND
mmetsp:Transcript_12620/g.18932  ORF Transcript_12620/g.18932 Transcript_12620/m.18932 type:complete len:185 (+) Transcript_12620:216-770(+)